MAITLRNTKGSPLTWEEGDENFRELQLSSNHTYTPAGTGAVASTVQAKLRESVSVKDFGAVGNGATDDTAAIQAAIDYATANSFSVFVPGGPYLITSISVTCKVIGSINNRFGSNKTFTSAVGAGVYAITLEGILGALENVTLVNTGAGNGINAKAVSTNTVLKDISVVTTYTLATGSGSIGISYGSDDSGSEQAITCVFDTVNVRGYDICHRMRYYSNSNVYRKLYALNTTTDPSTASTYGYYVNGRGGIYDGCVCESNFTYALYEPTGAGGAEENTYINPWFEGEDGMAIVLSGMGSAMINPYGVLGIEGESPRYPMTVGAYSTVIKKRGPTISYADFDSGIGVNLLQNAEFTNGLGGLNWAGSGAYVVPSGDTIFGFKSVSIENASAVTTITGDHVMSYLDLNVYTWLRGRKITFAAFGIAESGVTMSIRAIIRNAGGSNVQYGTSGTFSTTSAGIQKVSVTIPIVEADARYLVFRVYASGVTAATPSVAGQIAMPMVFVGNDLQDVTPRHLTDGANTIYGNQTFQGGGYDSAHIILGANHIWVDSTGDLRIKSSAPTSDTDGTIVGTQS